MMQLGVSQSRRFIFTIIFVLALLVCVILSLLHAKDAYAYSGPGDGSVNNPYQIATCGQLQEMASDLGASYVLKGDIDCSDTANWNNNAGFVPIGDSAARFDGILEGANYTISGLTIDRPGTDYVGPFGFIGRDGVAQHFKLKDVSISGQNYVGGVAGASWGYVSQIGITGEVNGANIVGGATGNNSGGVENVYSRATISGVPGSGVGGGLVGQNGGFTMRSYSTGVVPNGSGKGGLIGDDFGSGGVFGSFWDTQTSGTTTSDEGTGKTTAEMKNVATYTDTGVAGLSSYWDFVGNPYDDTANDDTWNINPLINQGYPYLTAQYPAAPTATITNSSGSLTTNSSATKAKTSLRGGVVAAQASTSTTSQDVTNEGDTTKHNNPNSVVQTDNSNDNIKKSDTTSTNFTPWAIGGSSLLILILAGYIVYRRLRTAA